MSVHFIGGQYDSDASIQFNLDRSNLEEKDQGLYDRLLDSLIVGEHNLAVMPFKKRTVSSSQNLDASIQITANKIRSTISSWSSHSALSVVEASKKPGIFDCVKAKGPFQIVCQANTDYTISGYGREIQIHYRHDDLFFMGYSVAILDCVYRNKDEAWNTQKGTYLPVLVRANAASSDEEFEKILQDRESLETMITWFKDFVEEGAQYSFDEKGLPYIRKMFEKVEFSVAIVKQKQKFSICFKSETEFDEIFQAEQPYGELMLRGKNQVSYFSG